VIVKIKIRIVATINPAAVNAYLSAIRNYRIILIYLNENVLSSGGIATTGKN